MNERQRNPALFAIDPEVRIQGQNRMPFMYFSHAYDTRIGERHGRRRVPFRYQDNIAKDLQNWSIYLEGDPRYGTLWHAMVLRYDGRNSLT